MSNILASPSDDLRPLGERLRAARLHAGLSQSRLAAAIGRSQSTVSMVESGKLHVSERYVRDVLEACGLPRGWSTRSTRRTP